MKRLRFFLFIMVICLASGVKAQFYDSADDIYYYVSCDKNGNVGENGIVLIFNFDGKKACELSGYLDLPDGVRTYPHVSDVKRNLQRNKSYYDELIENTEYVIKHISGNTYQGSGYVEGEAPIGGTAYRSEIHTFIFSADRNMVTDREERTMGNYMTGWKTTGNDETLFKKVDKSFFNVGRSRNK